MISSEEVKQKIQNFIENAEVFVQDVRGTQDYFHVDVMSPVFSGKTKIEQHQMVYAALGDSMKNAVHALQINTRVPKN